MKAARIVFFRSINGQWCWSLRSANGRVIADGSETYKTKGGVKAAIARLKAIALPQCEVKEKA